ncbi:MAG: YbbR-like domain-containing protein [Candidatus Omnitrophota bacterium]|jgi:hypothetical protein
MKIIDSITHNFWLKVFSLILAVATWFYVFDIVNPVATQQRREDLEQVFMRHDFTIKEAPVRPVFRGKAPEGYAVLYDKVKVEPSNIMIYGPEELLNRVTELKTDIIDLSEYTRSVKLRLGVHSDVKHLEFKKKVVDVYVPVEKAVAE